MTQFLARLHCKSLLQLSSSLLAAVHYWARCLHSEGSSLTLGSLERELGSTIHFQILFTLYTGMYCKASTSTVGFRLKGKK